MAQPNASNTTDRVTTTCCAYDCGGRCVLKVRVSGGRVQHIGTENDPGSGLRACGRGLAQGEVVHSGERLTLPLLRVGKRGDGEFEPIEWDEALDRVARELVRVKEQHGPHSVFLMDSYGAQGALHASIATARRFFGLFGGCTTRWGNPSLEGAIFASRATFGGAATGSTRDTLCTSQLIILWGWNPAISRFGPDTVDHLKKARHAGARVVCIDPRRSPSATALADQWIPIRPGTDAAMLLAMAQVMITEEIYDADFVARYTEGFELFADSVLGNTDGVPKTPAWAQQITGVPADTIERLAREYATTHPAALCAGWAPGRTAFGEQFHRAAQTLSTLTGNIGREGGWVGGGTGILPMGFVGKSLPAPRTVGPTIHGSELYDALLQGKAGGYPSDLKLLYAVGSNFLNQFQNVNKGVAALQAPEFVVVHDLFLTPTARHADVVLPVAHFLEREDIGQPWAGGTYFIHADRTLDPLPETRTDLEIFTALAARMGIEDYNDRSDQDWLREFVEATPALPDYDTLKRQGVHHLERTQPWVAFRDQIENPADHPFRTPSGKIEIFSSKLAEQSNPQIPPIPTYLAPWEGPADPLTARYPLQLVTPHSRGRINSQGDNIHRLKKLADDRLWLNPTDARKRGIADGDRLLVFNERGRLGTTVWVTERIMEGVVSLDAGAWYRPDESGVDRGGCVNVLTIDRRSPGGAFTGSTCLVEVKKDSQTAT